MPTITENYRKATFKGKITIILSMIAVMAAVMVLAIYCLGTSIRNIPGNDKTLNPFYYALKTKFGRPLTVLMILVILFVFILIFLQANKKNYVKKDDERGVHFMEQATHGSAEWMDKERAKQVFTVDDIRNTNEVIYGQFTDNGEEVVGYKKTAGAEFNRNIFVMAPSGSGKSFTQVKTDLVQHVKAGDSVAVTDPDGGIYNDLAVWCREMGAKVHVINFADPAYSECWNMVQECINPVTERLDGSRLNMFVNTFMVNTGEGTKDFFYKSATNLIKAVIGYTCYWNEKEILNYYERLYLQIIGASKKSKAFKRDEFFKRIEGGPVSFGWCREWILKAAVENGYRKEAIEPIFDKIKEYADMSKPFTMEKVYYYILHFDEIEKKLDEGQEPIEPWHPAWTNYVVFKSNDTDQVRKSAIQGAQLRFEMLIDPNITYILSHDGLDMNRFNLEQTVLFVITQDKSDETDPIASLLFTFLFKDVQDVHDKNKHIEPNPCLGSAIILDDFFSLGVIGGDPKTFTTTMADARKRDVFITIVIQQYRQLPALYGDDFKDSIQGNCATLVYLGGNDPETIKFISEFAGESTVLDEVHEERSRILSTGALKPGYRSGTSQRNLITMGEARTWKNEILVIQQGEQPLKLRPFPWIQLPEYRDEKFVKSSVYKDLKPIYDRIQISDKDKEKVKAEAEAARNLDKVIENLTNFEFDSETGEVIEIIDDAFEDAQEPEQETAAEESAENGQNTDENVSPEDEEERAVEIARNDDETDISFKDLLKGE